MFKNFLKKFFRNKLIILAVSFFCLTCWLYTEVLSSNPFLTKQNTSGSDNSSDKAIIIVLDCSGSMSEMAETSQSKMLSAKKVLEEVMSQIEPNVQIGLRVYGSGKNISSYAVSSGSQYELCQDTDLLVSPNTGNRGVIIQKLRDLKPFGATPISLALREAVKDLEKINAKEKSVVLISDGIDTCSYDPCLLAESMKKTGVNIKFNVVGFGVSKDYNALKQLDCVAKATDGKFYTADTSLELLEGLSEGIGRYNLRVTGEIREINE